MSDGPVRLTRRLAPWFEAAFKQRAMHEDVTWDITLGVQPTQNGPATVLLIIASLPSVTLGHAPHALIAQLPALGLTEAAVDKAVADTLEQLLKLRTAELSTTNGQGGAPVAQNKLIIPGA